MYKWTIETHQGKAGSWVGVVKQREKATEVSFMSAWQPTAMFAFVECLNWLQAHAPGAARELDADGFPQAALA